MLLLLLISLSVFVAAATKIYDKRLSLRKKVGGSEAGWERQKKNFQPTNAVFRGRFVGVWVR